MPKAKDTPIEFTGAEAANAVMRAFDFLRLYPDGVKAFEAIIGKPFDEFSYGPDDYVESFDTGWKRKYRKLDIGNGISFNIVMWKSTNGMSPHQIQITCYFERTYLESITFSLNVHGQNPQRRENIWNTKPQKPLDADDAKIFWDQIAHRLRAKVRTVLNAHEAYLERAAFYDKMKTELDIKPRKKKK